MIKIKHLILYFFLLKINFPLKIGNASQFWHVFQKSALFWNYTNQQTQTHKQTRVHKQTQTLQTNISTQTNPNT
jgi:hypothetical protein